MADELTINGHRYSWASIEFHIKGERFPDVTEISYSTSGEPGLVRGTGMRVIGDTRGEADNEGSITMLKSQADRLIQSQGNGFMLKRFNISVSWKEDEGEGGIITDTLEGVRLTNIENNPSQGTDAATVSFDMHIFRIKYNGIDPFEDNP
jgi:hypothetical protein